MTVTIGEAESQLFGQKVYDAKKFRIPSDTGSFEVVMKRNLKIVIKTQDDEEYQGESCDYRQGSGAAFSFGCFMRGALYVIGWIVGKWFGCF